MINARLYVSTRVLYATDLITVMRLHGPEKHEFIQRHYHTTRHALAAMGCTNGQICNILKEVEQWWTGIGNKRSPWPYPSLLEKGVN